jgi:DNA-binding CsgD family transcriptional regulator
MAGNQNSGRKAFNPTDEEREKVRVLKAGGMSNEAIAEAIGISEPTLTKHFSSDLEIGAARVTGEMLMARYRSAMGGNVSAQNKMLEQVGAVRARDKRAPAAPKLGKKEQQALAAKSIGGKFAPPAPPKLVVSND